MPIMLNISTCQMLTESGERPKASEVQYVWQVAEELHP
jgi:hypothetical protein